VALQWAEMRMGKWNEQMDVSW